MINLDDGIIIQNPPSNNGGDSCNRTYEWILLSYVMAKEIPFQSMVNMPGTIAILEKANQRLKADGRVTRHPTQIPWNNPNNLSRDQAIPYTIVNGLLNRAELHNFMVEKWKRLGFYPNIDRDYPGTTKSIFPQYWKAGQRFDDRTIIEKDGWIWKPNYRDISDPSDWAMDIRALKLWFLYPLVMLGDLFSIIGTLVATLITDKDPTNCDDMQALMKMIQAKLIYSTPFSWLNRKLYFKLRPKNQGNSGEWLTVNPYPDNAVMGAISWFFSGFADKGNYNSPDFIPRWKLVLDWLRK